MIFFAVAGPTPGSASSCAWVAVLRSTGPAGAAALAGAAATGATARRTRTNAVTQDSKPALFNLENIANSPFPGRQERRRTHFNPSIINPRAQLDVNCGTARSPANPGSRGRTR